jgi:alpha-1,3-glucan synthase
MLPDSLGETLIYFTSPPTQYLAFRLEVNDGTLGFRRVPVGSHPTQIFVYVLLWTIPVSTGIVSVWIYMSAFYSYVRYCPRSGSWLT